MSQQLVREHLDGAEIGRAQCHAGRGGPRRAGRRHEPGAAQAGQSDRRSQVVVVNGQPRPESDAGELPRTGAASAPGRLRQRSPDLRRTPRRGRQRGRRVSPAEINLRETDVRQHGPGPRGRLPVLS